MRTRYQSRRHRDSAVGTRNGNAKLTEADVVAIRQCSKGGMNCREIAKQFGMSYEATGNIIRGKTWQHVECPA